MRVPWMSHLQTELLFLNYFNVNQILCSFLPTYTSVYILIKCTQIPFYCYFVLEAFLRASRFYLQHMPLILGPQIQRQRFVTCVLRKQTSGDYHYEPNHTETDIWTLVLWVYRRDKGSEEACIRSTQKLHKPGNRANAMGRNTYPMQSRLSLVTNESLQMPSNHPQGTKSD